MLIIYCRDEMQEQNKRQIIQLYFNVGFDCFYSAGFFKYRYVYVFSSDQSLHSVRHQGKPGRGHSE